MALFNFHKKTERSHYPVTNLTSFAPQYYGPELNPTVGACVNKIANTLSILPLNLYAHTKMGKRLAVSNPVFRLLEHPAFEETPSLFYNDLYRQILLGGNGYVHLSRNAQGAVVNMEVCDYTKVEVKREVGTHQKIFTINGQTYTERDILHIPYPGAGYDGLKGVSPAQTFRDLIELDNALIIYIKTYFDNSIGSRYGLELDDNFSGKFKDLSQAYGALIPLVQKYVIGNKNAGKIMVPPPGSKFVKLDQPTNAEAELKGLLDMVERQICNAFNVPYEVLNGEASKYDNLESKQNDFLSNCIQPLGNHICESFEKLLPAGDTALFIMYEYKNLLTTNTQQTIDYLAKEVQSGLMSLNEARSKLGLTDIGTAGDYYWMPGNLIPQTEETIQAVMAKQKAINAGSQTQTVEPTDHNPNGDDK